MVVRRGRRLFLLALSALPALPRGLPNWCLYMTRRVHSPQQRSSIGRLPLRRCTGAAVPGVPLTDSLKQVDENGVVVSSPDRRTLRAVQTPQAFRFDLLLDAHRRAAAAGRSDLTDDAGVVEWSGHPVHVFEGEASNMKLTTSEDMEKAQSAFSEPLETRVGGGYDVHAFTDGDAVMLGGVSILARSRSGRSFRCGRGPPRPHRRNPWRPR